MHSLINWIYMAKYLENNYDHDFYHIQNDLFFLQHQDLFHVITVNMSITNQSVIIQRSVPWKEM